MHTVTSIHYSTLLLTIIKGHFSQLLTQKRQRFSACGQLSQLANCLVKFANLPIRCRVQPSSGQKVGKFYRTVNNVIHRESLFVSMQLSNDYALCVNFFYYIILHITCVAVLQFPKYKMIIIPCQLGMPSYYQSSACMIINSRAVINVILLCRRT